MALDLGAAAAGACMSGDGRPVAAGAGAPETAVSGGIGSGGNLVATVADEPDAAASDGIGFSGTVKAMDSDGPGAAAGVADCGGATDPADPTIGGDEMPQQKTAQRRLLFWTDTLQLDVS